MSGYDDMARHVRDALEESEVQADGSCIIRPEHYLQLNADFEAWDEADDAKRDALREGTVPDDGWVMVPRVPTEAMLEAAEEARVENTDRYLDGSEVAHGDMLAAVWTAMLAAASVEGVIA